MSYILDSLRKAEQKRQADESLRMPVFFGNPPPVRKKRPFLLYLLFVVLFFNGIAIFLFLTSHWSVKNFDKAVVVAKDTVSSHSPANTLPSYPTTVQAQKAVKDISNNSGEAFPKHNDNTNGLKLSYIPKVTEKKPVEIERLPVERPAAPKSADNEKDAAGKRIVPPKNKLFSLNDLPAAVKGNLPAFKVSGHAYSPNRQNRVTRVNEKILQEGEELSAGIKVEEIVPDGIIFNYQGYRFFVTINEHR